MFAWGFTWPIKKVIVASVPPLWAVAIRTGIGAVALTALALATGRLARPPRADLPVLVSVTLLHMVGFTTLSSIGLELVPAGRSAVLAYTTPLWVVPGALLFLGEKLDRLKALGLALGIGGVLVLFNPFGFDWTNASLVHGNALLMAAAFAWAAAILVIRGQPWRLTPLQLAPWQMLLGALVLLPAALAFEGPLAVEVTPRLVVLLIYNGPICIGFCGWAVIAITRSLPAVTSSLSFLAVPAFGIAASAVALRERVDLTLIGGFALILLGMLLVGAADRRRG